MTYLTILSTRNNLSARFLSESIVPCSYWVMLGAAIYYGASLPFAIFLVAGIMSLIWIGLSILELTPEELSPEPYSLPEFLSEVFDEVIEHAPTFWIITIISTALILLCIWVVRLFF